MKLKKLKVKLSLKDITNYFESEKFQRIQSFSTGVSYTYLITRDLISIFGKKNKRNNTANSKDNSENKRNIFDKVIDFYSSKPVKRALIIWKIAYGGPWTIQKKIRRIREDTKTKEDKKLVPLKLSYHLILPIWETWFLTSALIYDKNILGL